MKRWSFEAWTRHGLFKNNFIDSFRANGYSTWWQLPNFLLEEQSCFLDVKSSSSESKFIRRWEGWVKHFSWGSREVFINRERLSLSYINYMLSFMTGSPIYFQISAGYNRYTLNMMAVVYVLHLLFNNEHMDNVLKRLNKLKGVRCRPCDHNICICS